MIVGLYPGAERYFSQIVLWSGKLHVVADAGLLKVKHKVGRCKKFAAVSIEEMWTHAGEGIKRRFILNRCDVFRIAKRSWQTFTVVPAWNFITWIVNQIAHFALEACRAFAAKIKLNKNLDSKML